ncbi:MAG: hypothetical protein E5V52_06885 [Mesorhizobium sp.]|uniref:hypothetical protein n=1 Tax=Mesorhizobium sp. M2A.F.Ca.ET.067.02.1.1 TaxID=2496749 RepID=UPI000FD411F5|nr:hypothetical protein [Mesorhizobium sp. M2A.F.Ca.ET.067.02.1.1]RUW80456.1 hypothetical protein EOA28_04800 [Mesorhizobium sp. M2A.F.Ca.ET.067.02.1.1]TIU58186.1 MAG: hypothetical protein E5W35_05610 [Mesorhizobium sp.]TIW86107.1 MAG: hypothetical protein E5V52_06885 [Mesorhizobium sp.]
MAQYNCDILDDNSDIKQANNLLDEANEYFMNAAFGSDPVEQCDDMTSAVDALKQAYEIIAVCDHPRAIRQLRQIRSYNEMRGDYCRKAQGDQNGDDDHGEE